MGITTISKQYHALFMRKRQYLAWRAPRIVAAIIQVLKPASVIDFGCSCGDLVNEFLRKGVPAFGVDGSLHAKEYVHPTSLLVADITRMIKKTRIPSDLHGDLGLCIETFSVIPRENWPAVLNNLLKFNSRLLIGLGAPKRQDLEEMISKRGLGRDLIAEEKVKVGLEDIKTKPAVKAFYNGLMIWQ